MAELTWQGKSKAEAFRMLTEQEQLHAAAKNLPRLIITESYLSPNGQTPIDPASPSSSWYNRLILGDKLHVLPALLPEFAGKINLIYIDPPFMSGRDFNSGAQLAYSDKWDNNLDLYLQWLYETFLLLHLLLASTGSLYVHLDWRVTHYAKALLDEVFGFSPTVEGPGFKNEIIWHYQSGGRTRKRYARKHDTILFYTRSSRYCFHAERISERRGAEKRNHMRKSVSADGHIYWTIKSGERIYTYDEDSLMTPPDVWSDISHLHQKDPERNGYATQKPAALIERIILASSEEHDLILDCFCGSGVTPIVAQQLERRWIACDLGDLAINTTKARLLSGKSMYPFVIQHLALSTVEHEVATPYGIIGRENEQTNV